jgi:thymidine kinase
MSLNHGTQIMDGYQANLVLMKSIGLLEGRRDNGDGGYVLVGLDLMGNNKTSMASVYLCKAAKVYGGRPTVIGIKPERSVREEISGGSQDVVARSGGRLPGIIIDDPSEIVPYMLRARSEKGIQHVLLEEVQMYTARAQRMANRTVAAVLAHLGYCVGVTSLLHDFAHWKIDIGHALETELDAGNVLRLPTIASFCQADKCYNLSKRHQLYLVGEGGERTVPVHEGFKVEARDVRKKQSGIPPKKKTNTDAEVLCVSHWQEPEIRAGVEEPSKDAPAITQGERDLFDKLKRDGTISSNLKLEDLLIAA